MNAPWQPIQALRQPTGELEAELERVDAYRSVWKDAVSEVSDDFRAARARTLRRHAIETGIIERLYDVDWGVTETLVAEGLTLEAAGRNGGIDENALRTIQAQFDGLQLLVAACRDRRPLSVQFIRELHQVITMPQLTFEATDQLGRRVDAPLRHGQWKLDSNSVRRPGGSVMEYAPFVQVQSEMDRLIDLYSATDDQHPLVRAAWLHHRFILIHPFEDGNGRVARALTLLVLLSANFAPLVVARDERTRYLNALDAANDGDLADLVRLFADLEIEALRAEVRRPTVEIGGAPAQVAAAVARRITHPASGEKRASTEALAGAVLHRIVRELRRHAHGIEPEFRRIDPRADVLPIQHFAPPAEESRYWYHQIVAVARRMDFWASTAEGVWWARLTIRNVLGQGFRLVPVVVKVGQGETGFLAVIAFAERLEPSEGDAERIDLLEMAATDSVTLVHTETVDGRGPDIDAFIERAVSAAVLAFGTGLGA